MKVAWVGPAAEACRAGLRRLGMKEAQDAADLRVLPLADGQSRDGLARELQRDETPALLLVATPDDELMAQRLARAQDDVARLGDPPESLLLRLGRLFLRREAQREARRALDRDALTGLYSRRSFNERAEALLEALEPEVAAAVFLLDVDHFKAINDRHGHEVGDRVLVEVAASLQATLGPAVPVCRWGGEEFIWVALAPTGPALQAQALEVLAKLRERRFAADDGRTFPATASIGWSRLSRGMTLEEAVNEADQALYDAKANGRDRVRSWADMHEQAAAADADVQLMHFQNVAKVVNERATNLVTLFGKGLVEKARLAADQDRLTQLWNRGYFDRRLARDIELSRRDGRPLALVMMDLDHFGQFNRNHGLPTGDAVLRQFANVAMAQIRVVDWMARYGGEEFALVLPGTLDDAMLVAERIRETVESTAIKTPRGAVVQVTVSIGVTVFDAASMTTAVDLVQRASDALRAAKRDGRNRVAA